MRSFITALSTLILLIGGCFSEQSNKFIGEWYSKDASENIRFFADGSMQIIGDSSVSGDYSFPEEGYIRFDLGGVGAIAGPQILSYEFVDKNLILTSPNGEKVRYTSDVVEIENIKAEARKMAAIMDQVRSDLKGIETALKLFRLDNFSYPDSGQGLQALVVNPDDPEITNWSANGYYGGSLIDPWGTPYQYRTPGEYDEFDVYTLGADGQTGGVGLDRDLGHWDFR